MLAAIKSSTLAGASTPLTGGGLVEKVGGSKK